MLETPLITEILEGEESEELVDSHKRTFLRLAGVLGVGIAASTLLPKKAEAYVLGGTAPGLVGVKDASNTRINPAEEDGNLATIAGNIPVKGQTTMTGSMPVAIASDQTRIAVKVSDGSGNTISSTSNALDLNIRSGTAETSYVENVSTATATGTLAMGRYGTEVNALLTDAQGNVKVDDTAIDLTTIGGEMIPTTSPGVLPTTLVDMGGQPLDTFAGSLQVKVSNPQELRPQMPDVPVTGSGQGINQYIIQPVDVSGYAVGYLQVGGVFVATYNFEGSNSIRNSVWAAIPAKNLTLGTIAISNTVVGQYEIPFRFKYFRVRLSAFTSGLPQATLRFSARTTATNTQRIGSVAAGADGVLANVTAPNMLPSTGATAPLSILSAFNNASTYNTSQGIADTTNNDVGDGVKAVGLIAQVSEVPIVRSGLSLNSAVGTIITEKQFGNVRMSQDRSLNVDIKSADNSGRGVNLTALSEVRVQNIVETETLQQILDATNALHDDLLAVQPLNAPSIDSYGRYVGALGATVQNIGTANITLTASTAETVLITGIPGKYCHIRGITIANTDPTNSSQIDLRDTITGTIVHQWQVPARSTQYVDGGKGIFLPQTGAGKSWTITSQTSASSILVSVTYEIS